MNQRSAQLKQFANKIVRQQAAVQEAAKKQMEDAKKEEIRRMRNKLAQDERLQMEYNLMKHKLQQKGK